LDADLTLEKAMSRVRQSAAVKKQQPLRGTDQATGNVEVIHKMQHKGRVQVELKRMEDMGVISKVTEPTPWCAGLVVAPKAQPGKICLCVDLTHLNKWLCRERHILPAVDHTLAMLAGAKVFTKLDATSGFWQIPLSEESQLLTTFITPFGRYALNRLPADPEKVRAITEMPEPTGVDGVRRVMGMANYLATFLPHLASYTRPIKDLLSEKNEWCWGAQQKEAFQRLQNELSSSRVLAPYSPTAETCVSADASSFGLGAVINQQQTDGTWRPIMLISRGLSEAEKHYAQIEKEALAETRACERLTPYLLGLKFTLETDHKPLVPLLSTKAQV